VAKQRSKSKDTAGHRCESLRIQEFTLAAGIRNRSSWGAGYLSGYGMFWKGLPTWEGCTKFTSDLIAGRETSHFLTTRQYY
jgi:hypothetical protein